MNITVTRGLAELKLLDSRIRSCIAAGVFVGAVRGSKEIPLNSAVSKEQLTAQILSSKQQVEALIGRREAIKRAIIKSNGVTQVTLNGHEITVAEAIEKKASIQYQQLFINQLQAQYAHNTSLVNQQNTRVDQDIEKRVMAVYGNDKGKVTPEQHDLIAQAVKVESQAKLLDPLNAYEYLQSLKAGYEEFVTEVDFVLSESNARTTIEIPD